MNCDKCEAEMIYNYEVEERHVVFVLWDCECGHKYLERRYRKKQLALVAS